ncbi:MAG: succinate dehydrogenase cytochrome b subunit [Verrucomicrobiota bacterium]
MNLFQRIWRSSLGKKYLMALTGLALFAFVVGHLLGNLQVFGKPELINSYAHFLKSKPGLLWGARLGLLATVAIHVVAALTLSAANKAARPVAYAGGSAYGSDWRSRYMLVSGLVILAFVVFHLLHYTAQLPALNGGRDVRALTALLADGTRVQDVYAMMVLGFQKVWVSVFYLIAQALLFIHLGHGLSSMFQSLGLRNHVWWPRISCFAKIASLVIFLGYASIPVAVLAGLGGEHVKNVQAPARVTLETLR